MSEVVFVHNYLKLIDIFIPILEKQIPYFAFLSHKISDKSVEVSEWANNLTIVTSPQRSALAKLVFYIYWKIENIMWCAFILIAMPLNSKHFHEKVGFECQLKSCIDWWTFMNNYKCINIFSLIYTFMWK